MCRRVTGAIMYHVFSPNVWYMWIPLSACLPTLYTHHVSAKPGKQCWKYFYISLTVHISQFTVYKTPTKCTSLYHFFISLDPYICFGLCKNHHQGVSKLHIFTSNGISVLIVMQYLSVQLPFTYKISLKSELFEKRI